MVPMQKGAQAPPQSLQVPQVAVQLSLASGEASKPGTFAIQVGEAWLPAFLHLCHSWAVMCLGCARARGDALGLGVGQVGWGEAASHP